MQFLQDILWYLFLLAPILIIVSFLYYKAEVEKKGKQFLRIPFFVFMSLYVAFVVIGFATSRPSEMGALAGFYMIFAFPFICAGLFLLVPIVKFLFRVFRITTTKRLRIFLLSLFIFPFIPFIVGLLLGASSPQGFESRAIKSGDAHLCDKIDAEKVSQSDPDYYYRYAKGNTYAREACKMRVVGENNNFEVCKTLTLSEQRNECFSLAAVRTGNQKWCDSLEGNEKLECKASLTQAFFMKEKYCTKNRSYDSCMKKICQELFYQTVPYRIGKQLEQCVNILQNSGTYREFIY